MSTSESATYQQSWLHLMGSLDELIEQSRANAAKINPTAQDIDHLLAEAQHQRTATEAAFREFMDHRERLSHLLDQIQRELAVAGMPLKGDIS